MVERHKKLIVLALLGMSLLWGKTAAQVGFRKNVVAKQTDSTATTLHLPNRFLKTEQGLLPFSTHQMISAWVIMHRNQLMGQIRPELPKKTPSAALPRIDWSLNQPGRSVFGLDYRESSLYVPENVQDYIDYSMGRERYVPIASLALASYLAYEIYQRYGYLLHQREEERYHGVYLDSVAIAMMEILWEEPGLVAADWYNRFNQKFHKMNVPFLHFQQRIQELDEKMMLKTRKMENDAIRYFPAISRQDFMYKLKQEMSTIDYLNQPVRYRQIQEMLRFLDRYQFTEPSREKHIEIEDVR